MKIVTLPERGKTHPARYDVRDDDGNILYKSYSMYDTSLVYRFLIGAKMTYDQMARYDELMKNADATPDQE